MKVPYNFYSCETVLSSSFKIILSLFKFLFEKKEEKTRNNGSPKRSDTSNFF